mmetsp:Transcript_25391/g.37425  ORF Transcript_25391/g.37425 Transcript_25391/m.37425 type:complete len:307 (-) Transcript_25391:861-1781(-)
MMSNDLEAEADIMCCASCGITKDEFEYELVPCWVCNFYLVRYCSEKCHEDHRPHHEALCKERVLRNEILFRQPESTHLGDCPICLLPMSTGLGKSMIQSCCSKTICDGCSHSHYLHQRQQRLDRTCPFCRHTVPKSKEEANKNNLKRIEANDPVALRKIGMERYHEGNYENAFEYLAKAAELGDIQAQYYLGRMYQKGEGVDKDEKKEVYFLEKAAIAGHPDARYNLACYEVRNERFDRAVKHWIIAANLGYDKSMMSLMSAYSLGSVSKEDFESALRAHQAAVDATKSPQREVAEEFRRKRSSVD